MRNKLREIETLLPQFQALCEQNFTKNPRQITAALDETFFSHFLILVLMDLRSGYLLLEEVADDRCFDTWLEKTTPRLESLGLTVTHAISDRARALIKMAVTGFECESGADLFHAQQDVSRFLSGTLGRRVSASEKALEQAKNAKTKASEASTETESAALIEDQVAAEQTLKEARQASSNYHDNLQGIGDALHPYALSDNSVNSAQRIEKTLESRAQAFEKIANEQKISDHKGSMKKFRKQFSALAVSVTFWWSWVHETLQALAVDSELEQWLTASLLPTIYWHQKMRQTKNPGLREKYHQAWQQSVEQLNLHPLTKKLSIDEIQRWKIWAENMAEQFHRSSSAVEGRNGVLSQMYHNGRGFTEKRLQALTVVHNYFIKREDGTTAAMRLFGEEHPDLFTWLQDQMRELPLPRKRAPRESHNPLLLLDVPS